MLPFRADQERANPQLASVCCNLAGWSMRDDLEGELMSDALATAIVSRGLIRS